MDLSPYILGILAIEMFKIHNILSSAVITDLFYVRQNNHISYFAIPNVKPVYDGTEGLSNFRT